MTEPTKEQIAKAAEALGVEPDQVWTLPSKEEQAENGAIVDQMLAQREAEKLATLAAQAVAGGEITPARAATLLHAHNPQAEQMFIEAWRGLEAGERVQGMADALEFASADEYAAHMQVLADAERERLEQEHQEALEELGRKQLLDMGETLRQTLATTPGLHADAQRLEKRVLDKILEANFVPEDDAGKQRLVAESVHEIAVADNLRSSLEQEAEAAWRSAKTEIFKRSGPMTATDAHRVKQNFVTNFLDQKIESTPMPDLALPASAAELEAREIERRRAQNEREQSFHERVGEIRERGSKVGERLDHGTPHTENRNAYREAMKRAEETAAFGEFATVRTGYGEDAVEPQANDGTIDEYGGAFPGYA